MVSFFRRPLSGPGLQRLAPLFYASIGGLAAGLGTAALVESISLARRFFFNVVGETLPFGRWSLVPVVALGGLLAGLIVRYLGRESRGHGVPDVMYAFENAGGAMPWRVTLSGVLATMATIGSGGSAGQEGPSVHIGAGIASLVGSLMRVGQEHRRLLVAVGAAGGISAVFNAPLTGSFFALEVVLRRFTIRNFSAVVLGAVLANVVYIGVMGSDTGLRSPAYGLGSGWEVVSFAVLGLGTAVVAILFVRGLSLVESLTERVRRPLFVPALAGALVGLIGVWHFQAVGTGTTEIATFLQGQSPARLLLLLVALKIVATSLTLGSGGTGGVFMPSLFLGAALGGAFGTAADRFVPGLAGPPGAYAVAGMAGVFAGAAAAPITSLLLAFEVSQDYGLVVPLMTVVVISTVTTQAFMRETIYSEGLRRIGIDINRERTTDRLATILVSAAARPAAYRIPPSMPVEEIRPLFSRLGADILPVVDGEKVVGMISVRDLLNAPAREDDSQPLLARDVMTRPPVTARASESVQAAAVRLDELEIRALAVVDDEGRLTGILDRAAVLAAYAGQSASLESQAALLRAIEPNSGRFERVRIRPGDPLAGKAISDTHFPDGSLIVSIRRDRRMLVPRSSMVLQPGDQLVILAEDEARDALVGRGILGSPEKTGGQASAALRGASALFHRWRQSD